MAEGLRQVSLDRPLADVQPARDLLVAGPSADEVRDHALAFRQALQAALRPSVEVRLTAIGEGRQLGDELSDELALDPDLASLDRLHGLLEMRGLDGPRVVPPGARHERVHPFGIGRDVGENEHLR